MGKERDKDNYVVKNNDEEYIISEEEKGNAFYYGKPLNGSVVVKEVNVDYLILNNYNVPKEKFDEVLKLFKELTLTKDESIISKIDSLVGDNRGFFFKKTIYKVKKNG